VLAFIPNLLVAVLILAAFSWLASLARNLVTAALQPTMANAKTIGVLAFGATFGFGVIAAATQIGVATTLIDILFVGIVGALALAFGLAFGLGGREEAARMGGNVRRGGLQCRDSRGLWPSFRSSPFWWRRHARRAGTRLGPGHLAAPSTSCRSGAPASRTTSRRSSTPSRRRLA